MANDYKIKIAAIDATKEAFNSVQKNISSVKGSLGGIGGAIAAAFSIAAIGSFAKGLIDAADQLQDLSDQTGVAATELSRLQNAATLNGSSAETMNSAIVKLSKSIGEAQIGTKAQKDAFEVLGISIRNANGEIKPTLQVFNELSDAFAGAEDGAAKVKIAQDLLGRSGSELIPVLNQGSAALSKYQSTFSDEFIKSAAEFNDNLDKLIIRLKNLAMTILGPVINALNKFFDFFSEPVLKSVEVTADAVGNVKKKTLELKEEIGDIVLVTEEWKKRIDEFDYNNWKKNIEGVVDGVNMLSISLDDVGRNAMGNLEESLLGVMTGTMKLKDAFKSMAQSIISDLIRMYIRYTITKPLFDAFFGAQTSQTPAPIYTAGSAPITPPGRAIGGPVGANKPYMVGERGPELFIPNASGAIVPSQDMSGGGVTINQTINVTTGIQQTVRTEIAQLLPQIAEAAKAAVVDAKRRGGTFAATFS